MRRIEALSEWAYGEMEMIHVKSTRAVYECIVWAVSCEC